MHVGMCTHLLNILEEDWSSVCAIEPSTVAERGTQWRVCWAGGLQDGEVCPREPGLAGGKSEGCFL